ncbi:PREDICTED: protein FAR1-RELATED SEQUENCE 4-like isoform X2 [Nelumbo nucifera]|uniref:Protein FAR1-RELATED SEQUENCE n=1 Tax=Nelumbo nucifera TaxID=4432 RepID=A0A1U7ZKF5_NELNU|nr:PREDICTED: protein FAR1-RELATED SEQUENCE 4-like isoform X2 [Nelumbo nucifera]
MEVDPDADVDEHGTEDIGQYVGESMTNDGEVHTTETVGQNLGEVTTNDEEVHASKDGQNVGESMINDGEVHAFEDVGQDVGESMTNDEKVHGEDERSADVPKGIMHFKPSKGMEFESLEEAYSFYREYARIAGFNTIKKNSSRSKSSGEFTHATFACSRQGIKRNSAGVSKPRPCYKIGCEACMHVTKRKHGKWVINKFNDEHNHELLLTQLRFFENFRSISPINKSNVEKDMRSSFDKEGHLAIDTEDTQAMLNYFIHMQNENPNFFYAIDLNDEQHLRNAFWVDAKGRQDYVHFGDVVSFDTTYLTNGYKIPFVPIIGVNHHFQCTVLGCALLADMTTQTFVWLMQTWLRAMGGIAPKTIVTDQNEAIKAAIAQVFSNVRHRFCLWHILNKIPEKLGHATKKHGNFMVEFDKCIYRSWTEEEFEDQWSKMVHIFELSGDEWLKSLYEDRKQWVPTFMRDNFFAGISTTQRSESIISYFDKFMYKETSLIEFVEQCRVALRDRYEKESKAESDSWHGTPALKSYSPYEKQMSTIYTHEIFKKFQVEVLGIVSCQVRKDKEDGTTTVFRVEDFGVQQDFIVAWDETKSEISCLCHCFEYNGFLCRHMMVVLHTSAVSEIPSHYILKRWTKDAKNWQVMNQRSGEVQYTEQRYNDICQRALKLGEYGSISLESYNLIVLRVEELLRQCENMHNSVNAAAPTMPVVEKQGKRRNTNNKKPAATKQPPKKRKEQSILSLDGYHNGTEQNMQGYYDGTQQRMQELGQISSVPLSLDSYYDDQGSMQATGEINSRGLICDDSFATEQNTETLAGSRLGSRPLDDMMSAHLHEKDLFL